MTLHSLSHPINSQAIEVEKARYNVPGHITNRGLMLTTLDVFAVNDDEKPSWVGSAETLLKALDVALQHGEGFYFVFSHQTGKKDFYKVTSGTISPADS